MRLYSKSSLVLFLMFQVISSFVSATAGMIDGPTICIPQVATNQGLRGVQINQPLQNIPGGTFSSLVSAVAQVNNGSYDYLQGDVSGSTITFTWYKQGVAFSTGISISGMTKNSTTGQYCLSLGFNNAYGNDSTNVYFTSKMYIAKYPIVLPNPTALSSVSIAPTIMAPAGINWMHFNDASGNYMRIDNPTAVNNALKALQPGDYVQFLLGANPPVFETSNGTPLAHLINIAGYENTVPVIHAVPNTKGGVGAAFYQLKNDQNQYYLPFNTMFKIATAGVSGSSLSSPTIVVQENQSMEPLEFWSSVGYGQSGPGWAAIDNYQDMAQAIKTLQSGQSIEFTLNSAGTDGSFSQGSTKYTTQIVFGTNGQLAQKNGMYQVKWGNMVYNFKDKFYIALAPVSDSLGTSYLLSESESLKSLAITAQFNGTSKSSAKTVSYTLTSGQLLAASNALQSAGSLEIDYAIESSATTDQSSTDPVYVLNVTVTAGGNPVSEASGSMLLTTNNQEIPVTGNTVTSSFLWYQTDNMKQIRGVNQKSITLIQDKELISTGSSLPSSPTAGPPAPAPTPTPAPAPSRQAAPSGGGMAGRF